MQSKLIKWQLEKNLLKDLVKEISRMMDKLQKQEFV
jgi:hypothetical protein